MKVLVTGGGTGGHIYPAIAVAEALTALDPSIEIHYIGGKTGPETEIVPSAGIPFTAVESRKLRKLASTSTVGVIWSLFRGYRQAADFIRAFRPDVVISTGGFVAAAAALAAARQKIPLITQACDAVPGRTNLLLGKWARAICVWFEQTKRFYPEQRTVVTGVPLRQGMVSEMGKAECRSALKMDPNLFTVLIIGGSQGARNLNDLVVRMIPHLNSPMQILHQTGPKNLDDVKRAHAAAGGQVPYEARAYLNVNEIPMAYRAADVVICRCGISTLAEVTANAIPAIMVPLPTAYADHQTANAREVERAGGGLLLPESSLTSELLARNVEQLAADPSTRRNMSEAGAKLGKPKAAEDIARIVLAIGSGRHG